MAGRNVRQIVCNAFVAVDARLFLVGQVSGVHVLRTLALARKVHRFIVVAIATFQRIIGFKPGPFVLCQFQAFGIKLFGGVHGAKNLAPNFFRSLHFARHLIRPVVRHMTVRANGTHAGAVGVVNGGL